MKPLIDVHNHTVASGHAFSTLQEMAAEASRQGLEYLGITDHGPAVAGIHRQCWAPGTRTENTDAVLTVMHDPRVSVIAHPGDGTTDLDFEPLVRASRDTGTLLEINSSSMNPVRGKTEAAGNNLEILRLCKKFDVPVMLASDAHISFSICDYRYAVPLLEETAFPQELLLNYLPERFFEYTAIKM